MFDPTTGMVRLGPSSGSRAPSTALPSSIHAASSAAMTRTTKGFSDFGSGGFFHAAPLNAAGLGGVATGVAPNALDAEFVAVYRRDLVRSISTAEAFAELARRGQAADAPSCDEAHLWDLVSSALRDAETQPKYRADAVGLANVQASRRWHVSQHAHIQDLLLRHPGLRRATLVLSWLEETYRTSSSRAVIAQSVGKVRGEGDAVLLRRLILHHLRAGDLQRALSTAEGAQDAAYCCVLAAAEMQTMHEPWYADTAVVPLFGEYGKSEYANDAVNDHRLTNVSYLFEEAHVYAAKRAERGTTISGSTAVQQLDAIIAATLSGHALLRSDDALRVWEESGQTPKWQHQLWALLRCALITAFSSTLLRAGVSVPTMRYAQHLHYETNDDRGGAGSSSSSSSAVAEDATWADAFVRKLTRDVKSLLWSYLPQTVGGAAAGLSVAEELQVRTVLQLLQDDAPTLRAGLQLVDGGGAADADADDAGHALLRHVFDASLLDEAAPNRRLRARLVSHFLMCFDLATKERLVHLPVQGSALTRALSTYAEYLQDADWEGPLTDLGCLVAHLDRVGDKAAVLAAFVFAVRAAGLDRGVTVASAEAEEARLLQVIHRLHSGGSENADLPDALLRAVVQRAEAAEAARHALTQNPHSEALLLECLNTVDPVRLRDTLQRAFQLCLQLWKGNEMDILGEAVSILARHAIPKLYPVVPVSSSAVLDTAFNRSASHLRAREGGDGAPSSPWDGTDELPQFLFWEAVSHVNTKSKENMQLAFAQRGGSQHHHATQPRFSLAQAEAASRQQLRSAVVRVISLAKYPAGFFPAECAAVSSCVAWAIRSFAECCALVLPLPSLSDKDAVAILHEIFNLVQMFDESTFMEAQTLVRSDAEALFTAVRTARAQYGVRLHQQSGASVTAPLATQTQQ